MKEIKITSLTSIGESSLKVHFEETKKLDWRHKLLFKTAGFKHEVIGENPFTLVLGVNNRHADNPQYIDLLISEIVRALKLNGADRDKDYIIEV